MGLTDFEVISRIQARLYEPPDEQCHAWVHLDGCDCPTVADLEAMDEDFRNKARMEDL